MTGNRDYRGLPDFARQRTDSPRCFKSAQSRERDVHQYGVISTTRHRINRRFASLYKINSMTKLAQDRVHHDAPIGIVLGAKNGQRPRRYRRRLRPF